MTMLRWTVEFAVDSSWVADGFDLTDERAKEMLNGNLRYAYGHELKAKVTKYPAAIKVAKLQGYSDKDGDMSKGIAQVERIRKGGKL